MTKCADCGQTTAPGRRVCKDCSIEDRHGTSADHFDTNDDVHCWVQDVDGTWHASIDFEGTRHVTACGEALETPVADVKHDPRYFNQAHTCEACERAFEADETEATVPDGGDFERASELATDGGAIDVYEWVLENVHEYPAGADARWGSRGNLVHQGRKLDGVDKADVQEAIARAINNHDLLSWHGLLALAKIDRLREIVRIEHEEHDFTRQILVGKCNKLIAKKKRKQADESAEREVATDGGENIERRETITESTDGGLQIGEQSTVDEIDDVCSVLEALQDEVDNPDVEAALRSATDHAWRASVLQRINENTDVRMIADVGGAATVIHGPDPVDFARKQDDRGSIDPRVIGPLVLAVGIVLTVLVTLGMGGL